MPVFTRFLVCVVDTGVGCGDKLWEMCRSSLNLNNMAQSREDDKASSSGFRVTHYEPDNP
jgi:hypothetical protein